jgi:ADP-ribose pyrophosphatase YjhB (NUDIX family)
MMDMSSEVRWLTAPEEHLWRGWLKLNTELASTLQRELQEDAGLSMPDFEVLVHLTDNPEGRVRVTDLAGLLQGGAAGSPITSSAWNIVVWWSVWSAPRTAAGLSW